MSFDNQDYILNSEAYTSLEDLINSVHEEMEHLATTNLHVLKNTSAFMQLEQKLEDIIEYDDTGRLMKEEVLLEADGDHFVTHDMMHNRTMHADTVQYLAYLRHYYLQPLAEIQLGLGF